MENFCAQVKKIVLHCTRDITLFISSILLLFTITICISNINIEDLKYSDIKFDAYRKKWDSIKDPKENDKTQIHKYIWFCGC